MKFGDLVCQVQASVGTGYSPEMLDDTIGMVSRHLVATNRALSCDCHECQPERTDLTWHEAMLKDMQLE